MNKKVLIIFISFATILGGFFVVQAKLSSRSIFAPTLPLNPSLPTITLERNLTYKGVEGKNALTLLKEKATIEQDASGLVVSINGRKADLGGREYWAFYVNSQMAPVGPADYKTKNEDNIEWKIEKY